VCLNLVQLGEYTLQKGHKHGAQIIHHGLGTPFGGLV
jgi:hypothetical protein